MPHAESAESIDSAATDQTAAFGSSGGAGGAGEGASHAQLADQIRRLDRFVTTRLAELEQRQRDHDARERELRSLAAMAREATNGFSAKLVEAQRMVDRLDDASRAAERTLADAAGPLTKRIEQVRQLDRSVDQRLARVKQIHKQAGEAVDKLLLRSLREAKAQAGELIDPLKRELDAHVAKQTAVLEARVEQKVAELDVDVEEALRPLTQRFDAALADAKRQAEALAGSITHAADAARTENERARLTEAAGRVPADVRSGKAPKPVVETPVRGNPLQTLAERLKKTHAEAR